MYSGCFVSSPACILPAFTPLGILLINPFTESHASPYIEQRGTKN